MRMIVAFEKTERVRHIGHLDLLRAMQRALRRSGLPLRYSQGFNPHGMLSFASPLPVGVSGAEELMDAALEADVPEEKFRERLAPAMPYSLPMLRCRAVSDAHPKLMARLQTASYTAALPVSSGSEAMAASIPGLLERDVIWAVRRTKSGEKSCDIRPMLHALDAAVGEEAVVFACRVSLTERETLKPTLLLETLAGQAGIPWEEHAASVRLRRECLYGEKDRLPVALYDL
ncbi:MAG: TIGR03936 family radical SAM-associated protein [Firmicutes bacterium]|nr:TIGR03936 family radical SAM-associated protein [Bacillota bacterium]